jgi:hypothetical protein
MAVAQRRPHRGELWLSRPPWLLVAHVLGTARDRSGPRISYELLDADGSLLLGPVEVPFDEAWWRNFQPLHPRFG